MARPGTIATVPTIELKGRGPHRIWLVSDIHIGASEHDFHMWNAHLARAREERWRLLCLGDAFEMVGLSDRVAQYGALWEQEKPPPAQIREAVAAFQSVIFDAACEGNHDWRMARAHGVSAWDDIVLPQIRSKRSPAKYLGDGGYLRYLWGDNTFVICVQHGEGPVVNPLTTLYRMMLVWPDADVYAAGHTHNLLVEHVSQETLGGPVPKLCIRTGTYLGFARYAKRRLYGKPPTPRGSVLLTLEPDGSYHAEMLTA